MDKLYRVLGTVYWYRVEIKDTGYRQIKGTWYRVQVMTDRLVANKKS